MLAAIKSNKIKSKAKENKKSQEQPLYVLLRVV